MKRLLRKRNKGFTLIELMIVVAIIGILAAIAIPNFLRFQLRAKSSEGKVNIAAIRTAEVSYNSEFGSYVDCTSSPAAVPGSTKDPFTDQGGFGTLGWAPEGNVYFQYATALSSTTGYTIDAEADIDDDSSTQIWGYVHPQSDGTTKANGEQGCAGVWDGAAASLLDVVGPCDGTSGQSKF